MSYETIVVTRDGEVAKITLNRPERLNAASIDMAHELKAALQEARSEGARAILITGEGRAFCSGADLAARGNSSVTGGEASYQALTGAYNPLMETLATVDVPVVTAVNGPAAGVGCSIALAGDFVIAGESGYFLQAFVNIGLVPDGGASWMLPRLVGKARASQMMMLGEKIHGKQAEEWGLCYKCVADDQLQDEAMALAKRLAGGPTVALGVMRQNLASALDNSFTEALHAEAKGQRIAGGSKDAIEGGMAFLQKRKPQFKGE